MGDTMNQADINPDKFIPQPVLKPVLFGLLILISGIIIGSGQYGVASLSGEAADFLSGMKCFVVVKSTPEALQEWNRQKGKWIGLFHITC